MDRIHQAGWPSPEPRFSWLENANETAPSSESSGVYSRQTPPSQTGTTATQVHGNTPPVSTSTYTTITDPYMFHSPISPLSASQSTNSFQIPRSAPLLPPLERPKSTQDFPSPISPPVLYRSFSDQYVPAESRTATPGSHYEIPPPPSLPLPPWQEAHSSLAPVDLGSRHSQTMSPPTRSASTLGNAGRRLLKSFSSIHGSPRNKRFSFPTRFSTYGPVEEVEEYDISDMPADSALNRKNGSAYRTVKIDDGEDFDDAVGYDISSFEGPIGQIRRQPTFDSKNSASAAERDRRQMHYSYAAEFHQLEAKGKLTGGLGGGMGGATFYYDDTRSGPVSIGSSLPTGPRNMSDGISRGRSMRDVGLREAKERNKMVVIDGKLPSILVDEWSLMFNRGSLGR